MFWQDKRVVVTGGAGFLGSVVTEKLKAKGCAEIFVPLIEHYDLRQEADIVRMIDEARPDIIIHLAASVGGIAANKENPGSYFYDNAIMGIQLIEQTRSYGLQKFVCIGTICAYPKYTPVPFKEGELWNGYPEETNAPYGLAKKMLLVQLQAYRQQYGFNGIYLLPVNMYGPGDNFNLQSSHVIPAIIRKCIDAKAAGDDEIVLWGSGNVTREFLFVDDAADAILMAAEEYNNPAPVNIGTGGEISIRDLAKMIMHLTGVNVRIRWDTSRPDGQPRRQLDTTRAKTCFGFEAKVGLEEGLKRTIAWYRTQQRQ